MESTVGGYNGQITIGVTEPVKQGDGMNSYISYKVLTNTTLTFFTPNSELSVIRRYSDFDWLHLALAGEVPGCFLPPLPEKSVIGRFEPAFVEARRKSLENYLMRIASHAELVQASNTTSYII